MRGHSSGGPGAVDSQGYSLLYQLLSKQKDVDKLLLVKAEAGDVNSLVKRIAAVCAQGTEQMEKLSAADPTINLELEPLPAAEVAARKSIEGAKARALLLSGGKEFEVRLLLSQIEGMSYGTHLAATLAKGEEHPARKSYLEYLSDELRKLEENLLQLIQGRFRDPL